MNPKTLERYRAWRLKHPTLPMHYFITRPVAPPFEWTHQHGVKVARWSDDTFRYVARVVIDDDPHEPTECLGTWANSGEFPVALKRANARRHEYTHFIPAYSVRERQSDNSNRGMSAAVAYECAVESAKADMARAEDFGDGWACVGVKVEAYLLADDGYEDVYGEAALWGIESDCDDDYLTSVAIEQSAEAAGEARSHVERVWERIGQQRLAFSQ